MISGNGNRFDTLYKAIAMVMLTIITGLISGAWASLNKHNDRVEIAMEKLAAADKLVTERMVEHERLAESRLVRLELLMCMSYEERMRVLAAIQAQLNQTKKNGMQK